MDRYSILDHGSSPASPERTAPARENPPAPNEEKKEEKNQPSTMLQFPGEDGGKSLSEMAQSDLEATLQLLAERAQYITAATGAAIALREAEAQDMVCRASAGATAPEVGAHLQVSSGLSGESVRSRQLLRCDDADTDPRVNRESCRALGIASVVVMPLLREKEVIGVFELFSDKAYTFKERDLTALERLGEMVHTALEQAAGAEDKKKRSDKSAAMENGPEAKAETAVPPAPAVAGKPFLHVVGAPAGTVPKRAAAPATGLPQGKAGSGGAAQSAAEHERASIHKCQACGFPVSEGRALCLDCESVQTPDEGRTPAAVPTEVPGFLSQFAEGEKPPQGSAFKQWLLSHKFMVTLLGLMLVVLLVLWFWRPV